MSKIYKRSGDHSFHEIKEIPKNAKEVKHTGRFIFGVGEASNHNHIITVGKPQDLVIKEDDKGNFYFELLASGTLTHEIGTSQKTADHRPIEIPKGIYKQVHEREVDIFSKTVRRVID